MFNFPDPSMAFASMRHLKGGVERPMNPQVRRSKSLNPQIRQPASPVISGAVAPEGVLMVGSQPAENFIALHQASKDRRARKAAEEEANWDPSQHPSMMGGILGPGMSYQQAQLQRGAFASGPLPDPRWQAFGEALNQAEDRATAQGKKFKIGFQNVGRPSIGSLMPRPKLKKYNPATVALDHPSTQYEF